MNAPPDFAPPAFGSEQIGSESLVWLAGAACQLFRIPYDPRLLLQQFPPPHARTSLLEALQALGFRAALKSLALQALPGLSAPAFLAVTGGGDAAASELAFVLFLRCDGERITYLEQGAQEASELPLADFATRYRGEVLQLARQEAPAAEQDGTEKPKEFGFSWFVPELLKHKRIWRDILLASLVIQLVGLATPLFTQVIIDKVVVHQTENTLVVLGAALVMFMIFTSVMTWLRQYLVLHTGNRIDAVLGSQVFRHLLHLPAPYFEHRPTGTLVARLHGVETIREFVSGAAVTLLLDLPLPARSTTTSPWPSPMPRSTR